MKRVWVAFGLIFALLFSLNTGVFADTEYYVEEGDFSVIESIDIDTTPGDFFTERESDMLSIMGIETDAENPVNLFNTGKLYWLIAAVFWFFCSYLWDFLCKEKDSI